MMPRVLQLVKNGKNCAKSIALYDSIVQAADRTQEKVTLAKVESFL